MFHLKFHCSLWVAFLRVCVCLLNFAWETYFCCKNFRAWWTSWKITKWIRPRHAEIAFSKEQTDNKVNLICLLKCFLIVLTNESCTNNVVRRSDKWFKPSGLFNTEHLCSCQAFWTISCLACPSAWCITVVTAITFLRASRTAEWSCSWVQDAKVNMCYCQT